MGEMPHGATSPRRSGHAASWHEQHTQPPLIVDDIRATITVMPDYFIVRNINGTSWRKCACGSWLEHWRRETRSPRLTCAAFGCGNDAEVGAHVHELTGKRGTDWNEYIVPMCKGCNARRSDEEIELKICIVLVSANTQEMDCYLEPY